MKIKSWKDVNVAQWQDLTKLYTEEGNTNLDLIVKSLCILMNKTEHEVDSFSMSQINEYAKQISFTHEEVMPVAQRFIDVNGKRYRCIYDVRRMPCARYIETKVFTGMSSVNEQLHKIAACMVVPQKKVFGCLWYVDDVYDASKHSEYADDLLAASITDVLGSVIFFCNLYINSMWNLKTFLVMEALKGKKMTHLAAEEVVNNLCKGLVGITSASWLVDTRASS